MSDPLVLHWPLDALAPGAKVLDSGPNQITGTFATPPSLATDPKFPCLRLAGGSQYAVVPSGQPLLGLTAYTLSAWINWPGGQTSAVFGKRSPNIRLRLEGDGSLEHMWGVRRGTGLETQRTGPGAVPRNTWKHVAITHDGTTARILVDGAVVAESATLDTRVTDQEEFYLGSGNGTLAYTGLVAHFRVHNRALTPAEVLRDMADDQPPLDEFVRTYPLDFVFVNADDQPVLYIDDIRRQTMTLRVTNSSRTTVEALPLTGVSSAVHHFALRLRKGTLASGLTLTVNSADWAMVPEADGTALYFQWKNPRPIPPGTDVAIEVAGLNADGTDGTHGTQVELEYRNVRYQGQPPLTGTRIQYLDVVNHRGLYDIPLDVRFVGGDRVLCDGTTPNTLTLHIACTMRSGKGITFQKALPTSAFVVSFDAEADGDDKTPWALTKNAAAGGVKLAVTGNRWNVRKVPDRQRTWEVTPASDLVLAPGEYVELVLSEILALPKPGHAPVLVEYSDIPGYADGSTTAMVDRTPLLFARSSAGVNIAADKIDARFQIVHKPQDANGDALVIGKKTEQNLRLGYATDHTWIQSHVGLPLAINPLGNRVGVGTTGPLDSRVTVVEPSGMHLQLRRDTSAGAGGQVVYLELFQQDTPGANVTYPNLRFHHANKFWNRIEGRPEGFFFKDGPTPGEGLVDITARTVNASGLRIGTTGPAEGKATVKADGNHLQLRRDAAQGGGGQILYLELFQDTTSGTAVTYPSIRFHHGNKFWHRIEGHPDGIKFKDGNIPSDQLIDIHARTVVAQNIRIGGVTIGEAELRALQRLIQGQLEFDLWNVAQQEYIYAADYEPRDNDRRYVYTWRRKNTVLQGRWRIHNPS